MMVAIIAGLCVGAGLAVAWSGLRPAPEPLGHALARLDRDPELLVASDAAEVDRDTRWGQIVIRSVPPLARQLEAMRADLRMVGMTAEEHAARVAAYMAAGLFAGPWLALIGAVAGFGLPAVVPALVSLFGMAIGLLMPFARVKNTAAARREVFSTGLSTWCDIVVMSLAAGRGVEQAMETGAAAGQGWVFAELRGAFGAAYMRGETPWYGLDILGRELGIKEMRELASTISMAGEEGAAVRETLGTKSRTIRERHTADVEQEAASATEKMSLPAVLLVFGFLVFMLYPLALGLVRGF